MRGAVFALLAGCTFGHGFGTNPAGDGQPQGDGSMQSGDAIDDSMVGNLDGPTCTSTTFLNFCAQPLPTGPLNIVNADTINTDTDSRCRTVTQLNGGPVCFIYATSVNIMNGGSLTATGSRPLAIASTGIMTIGGDIDVSSRRSGQRGPASSSASCSFASGPQQDIGGAGGGAGGSFGVHGANGGTGDTDESQGFDGDASPGTVGPALASLVALRGGCRGQDGADQGGIGGQGGSGGHSGGALYLYAAQTIQFGGSVRATGAGASGGQVQAGGGGGGSGGLVVMESPSIAISGFVSANGGGGGEGGALMTGPVNGQPGADGALGSTPASGGMGSDNQLGHGGAGGAGTTSAVAGVSSSFGGGAGGGSVGIVKLIGTPQISGVVSPPPM